MAGRYRYVNRKGEITRMKVSENKPHSIHLRLTDEQYTFCKSSADILGVGVSDFIRMTVNALVVQSAKMKNVTLGDLEHEDNTNNI